MTVDEEFMAWWQERLAATPNVEKGVELELVAREWARRGWIAALQLNAKKQYG